jgi:hypothetical protein
MLFTCTVAECPSLNIEYVFEDDVITAECGGCAIKLEGQPIVKEENE